MLGPREIKLSTGEILTVSLDNFGDVINQVIKDHEDNKWHRPATATERESFSKVITAKLKEPLDGPFVPFADIANFQVFTPPSTFDNAIGAVEDVGIESGNAITNTAGSLLNNAKGLLNNAAALTKPSNLIIIGVIIVAALYFYGKDVAKTAAL